MHMLRPSMGITPQPSVGLCGGAHLAWCSRELASLGRGRLAACVVRSIQGELGSSLDTGANTHTHMRRTQFGDVGCSYDLTMAQTCLIHAWTSGFRSCSADTDSAACSGLDDSSVGSLWRGTWQVLTSTTASLACMARRVAECEKE